MKYKALVKKFSYIQLEELCERKEWKIPTYEQISKLSNEDLKELGVDLDYDLVWISDNLLDEDNKEFDDENYKYLYSLSYKKRIIANVRFVEQCIVIKKDIDNVK